MRLLKLLIITWSFTVQAGLPPLPAQTGQAGKFLTTNGVKPSWAAAGGGTIASAVGAVLTVSTASCPAGTILADGSAVSRTTYANLFTALGVSHGQGNGSTTFNLPDYRGRFLRGVDGVAGRDADKASRTSMATGGNSGNAVGSVQLDAFKSHTHTVQFGNNSMSPDIVGYGAGTFANSQSTSSTGGSETRPLNAYVNYCVVTESISSVASQPSIEIFNGVVFQSTAKDGVLYFKAPKNLTVNKTVIQIFTKDGISSGTLSFDLKKNTTPDSVGMTSIFTSQPSINYSTALDYGTNTGTLNAGAAVSEGDYLRLDITSVPAGVTKMYIQVYAL